MQEKEARALLEKGEFNKVQIRPSDNKTGWSVQLKSDTTENPAVRVLGSKRNRDVRIFKTTDAALRWCQNMGFDQVEVKLKAC